MKKGALMFIILRLNVYQSLKRLLQKHHQQPQSQLPQQEVSIRSIHKKYPFSGHRHKPCFHIFYLLSKISHFIISTKENELD